MKLYYAFSNIMLLTQTNIQLNVSEEEGDLLVWSTDPMDYHLAEIIREKGIFRNVWYLERPRVGKGKNVWSKIKNSKYKRNFYFKYLERLLADQKYDEFVTAGFWNDALIILKYIKKFNPQIKIGISEEGLLNYQCGDNHKKLYYMVKYTKMQKLKAYISGGRLFKYVQKNIDADYLSAPGLMEQKVNNEIIPLPAIDENNLVMKSIVDELFDQYQKQFSELIYEYKTRRIYYIAFPYDKAYDPINCNEEILNLIVNEVPLETLILKTHTNATAHRKNFGTNMDKSVFIDKNIYLFEVLYSHICANEDDKVFIVRSSSIAIYLTQMFKIEPIFIFTHRLYSRYHYGLGDNGDFYVEDLKKNMKHPERVLVPNSHIELKAILNELCKENQEHTDIFEPSILLENVVLNKNVEEEVKIVISAILHKRELSKEWGMLECFSDNSAVILNFYGKEGTGKGMAAEAVAKTLGKKVCRINCIEMEEKYEGNTSFDVQKIFERATDEDAVLVFDGADNLINRRTISDIQLNDYSSKAIRKTFFEELKKFDGIVIFITNIINNYDEAYKRKIFCSIHFEMPYVQTRTDIWKLHLNGKSLHDEVTAEKLAERYEGVSGKNIRDMVFYATLYAMEQGRETLDFSAFDYSYAVIQECGEV